MKSSRTIAAALVAALILAACASDTDDDADTTSAADQTTTTGVTTTTAGETSADEASITIEDFSFSGTTSVSVGTTVTVTNQDGVTHTWTSVDDVWDSGGLASGESFEFTFDEAGEYAYFCSIHPRMEGTITVEG